MTINKRIGNNEYLKIEYKRWKSLRLTCLFLFKKRKLLINLKKYIFQDLNIFVVPEINEKMWMLSAISLMKFILF